MPEDPPFRITITEEPAGVRRVRVGGDLDLQSAPQLETTLRDVAGEAREILLDLRDVGFMDSTGISLIVRVDAESRQDGFGLSLLVSPAVLRVVRLCDLEDLLPIRRD